MDGAKHKFNHIMISPDGSKFMFLHRWFIGERKFDSLIVVDMDGSNIKCLSDDDMVSHYFWHGDYEILGYLRDKEMGDKYYMLNVQTGKKEIVGQGLIDSFGDGHPHIHENKVLFDTYPNKGRMKELYIFDIDANELEKIGEFFESFNYYGETRCDLHPRFSFDGKKVFIDSVHESKRYLYMINLGDKNG
jgi:Tol biopolymer transport system component